MPDLKSFVSTASALLTLTLATTQPAHAQAEVCLKLAETMSGETLKMAELAAELSGLITTSSDEANMMFADQARMMADMQQQNMQNLLLQQQMNQQSQQLAASSRSQEAMHDAVMAMLNKAKEDASLIDQLAQEIDGLWSNLKSCMPAAKAEKATPRETEKPAPRVAGRRRVKTPQKEGTRVAPQEDLNPAAAVAISGMAGGLLGGLVSGDLSHGGPHGPSHTTGIGGGATRPSGGGTCAGGVCGGPGGFAISDIRAKQNVTEVGRLPNGLGLYTYRFNGSDRIYVGVIAQEVEKIDPSAVRRGRDGYLHVNYSRLGLKEMTWEDWVASRFTAPAAR